MREGREGMESMGEDKERGGKWADFLGLREWGGQFGGWWQAGLLTGLLVKLCLFSHLVFEPSLGERFLQAIVVMAHLQPIYRVPRPKNRLCNSDMWGGGVPNRL